MRSLWRGSRRATRHDVEAAHAETRRRIDKLSDELASQRPPEHAPTRDTGVIATAAGIAVAAAIGALLTLNASMSNTPSATSPGAIGVAILDDSSTAPGSWSVAVAFGRNDAAPSVFEIVVSNLDVSDLESDTPPRVVVYFCGAIRDSLAVTELNSGPLQVERLPATAVEFDSGLGYRSECDYTISAFSNGWQTLMSGTSAFQYENVDGSNVSYTAPRLTTLLAPEELLDETVMPLPRDSTVDVTLRDLPADLEIRSSTPQIPATGQTHWSFAAVPVTQPDVFRINGEVGHLINQSQVYLFAAGALSGVAGAALLWCLELALSEGGRGRSRSSRTTVPHRVPASRG